MNKGVIELYVEMIEGTRRIKEIYVYEEDGSLSEQIINNNRKADLTKLNRFTGDATVHVYFNGKLEVKGEFVNAGFSEEGYTMIEYYEDEVFSQ